MQQHALPYGRRVRAAARFHHGGVTIPELAREYRVNCATIGEATREFTKAGTLHAWQQMIGGS